MNINNFAEKITVRPTDRKIKQVKKMARNSGLLPQEVSQERGVCIVSKADILNGIKERIQISIEKMKRKG